MKKKKKFLKDIFFFNPIFRISHETTELRSNNEIETGVDGIQDVAEEEPIYENDKPEIIHRLTTLFHARLSEHTSEDMLSANEEPPGNESFGTSDQEMMNEEIVFSSRWPR